MSGITFVSGKVQSSKNLGKERRKEGKKEEERERKEEKERKGVRKKSKCLNRCCKLKKQFSFNSKTEIEIY